MTSQEIIYRLPFEIAARLQADDYFCDIPVVVAEEGNVRLTMEQKQAAVTQRSGKRGVGVIVTQLVLDDDVQNVQFGPLTFRIAIQIVENVELNRDANGTRKAARQVGRRIRDVFKNTGILDLTKAILTEQDFMVPVPLDEKVFGANLKCYQCNLVCLEGASDDVLSQAAMPQVTVNEQAQLSLSCATAGAEVWYTLDDSYPTPTRGNPLSTAKLYNDRVPLPVGTTIVRAVAYLPGSIASNVNRQIVTITT